LPPLVASRISIPQPVKTSARIGGIRHHISESIARVGCGDCAPASSHSRIRRLNAASSLQTPDSGMAFIFWTVCRLKSAIQQVWKPALRKISPFDKSELSARAKQCKDAAHQI
jgi:hypothetical protein